MRPLTRLIVVPTLLGALLAGAPERALAGQRSGTRGLALAASLDELETATGSLLEDPTVSASFDLANEVDALEPTVLGSQEDLTGPRLSIQAEPPPDREGGRIGASGYAELRLRDHLDVNDKRGRNRFRFRVRLKGELRWRGLFVGLGFRTASSGVAGLTSDNFTVDGSRWPFPVLNLAYLGYQRLEPDFSYRLEGGYIYNPFQRNPLLRSEPVIGKRSVQSRRLFDRDYTPVGVAAMGAWAAGPTRLFATGSVWSFAPQQGRSGDLMAGAQVGVAGSQASLAAAFYHFGRPGGELAAFAVKAGNMAAIDPVSGKAAGLEHEYQVLSVSSRLDVGALLGWRGASLLLEYGRNLGAPALNNSVYGQLTGTLSRRLKILVDGFYVEADATLAALADSDREFTDVAGFSTGVGWEFSKSFLLTLNYFGFWGLHDGLGMQHKVFLSFTMRTSL